MSENSPAGNLKLHLKSTDTNRFKTETGSFRADPTPRPVSPEGTIPVEQINDPLRARGNTGRLKKVSASETSEVSAVSPMTGNSKHETVKLRVVKAPTAKAPSAGSTVAAMNMPRTTTSAMKLPSMGGSQPSGTGLAPAADDASPTVKLSIPSITVKLPLKKPGSTGAAPGAVTPPAPMADKTVSASATGSLPEDMKKSTATLKIRSGNGSVALGGKSAAGSTLKIDPQAVAPSSTPAVGVTQQAPAPVPASGEPQLKQTGIKLSLKSKASAGQTVAVPAPPMEQSPAVAAPAAPHSGLKLKTSQAAATVAAPPMPPSATGGATAQVAPEAAASDKKAGKSIKLSRSGATTSSVTQTPAFIPPVPQKKDLGKLEGIASLLSFLALGAACYFIIVDFLKYV